MSDISKLYTTNSYGFVDELNHQNNLKHSIEDVLSKDRIKLDFRKVNLSGDREIFKRSYCKSIRLHHKLRDHGMWKKGTESPENCYNGLAVWGRGSKASKTIQILSWNDWEKRNTNREKHKVSFVKKMSLFLNTLHLRSQQDSRQLTILKYSLGIYCLGWPFWFGVHVG